MGSRRSHRRLRFFRANDPEDLHLSPSAQRRSQVFGRLRILLRVNGGFGVEGLTRDSGVAQQGSTLHITTAPVIRQPCATFFVLVSQEDIDLLAEH